MDDDANKRLAEAAAAQTEYAARLKDADAEIRQQKAAAYRELDAARSKKLEQAQAQADSIIAQARTEAEKARAEIVRHAQSEISEMVVEATEKLVLQSSASEAFDQFLSAVEESGGKER